MVDYSLNGEGVSETEFFGERVDQINFEFNETSSSKGCAFNFYDENNNRVTTAGTENPQWALLNNGQFYSGDGYNRWVDVTMEFDAPNGTVTATFRDQQSGVQRSATGNLEVNNYPTEVEFASALNQRTWPSDNTFTDTDIRFISSQSAPAQLEAPTNLSASASGNDVSLSWNSADGANGYNILRAPSSGGNFDQIASVGSNTTSFTDTGLQFNEDYAYKIESFN